MAGGDDDGTWAPGDAVGPSDATWAPDLVITEEVPLPSSEKARYRLGPELARGGLGRIVEGWDEQLDREVAVKQLLRPTPGAEARFDREMLLTARLQHPNIVPVFDGGRLEGRPYLAMRRVHGRSLGEALDQAGGLDDRMRLLPHLIDVANAMAYAHGQRVVHRDLKPDNILVGDFGETVVIDWGLAKDLDADITDEVAPPGLSLDTPAGHRTPSMAGRRSSSQSLTRVGSVMGTPRYMAPEQASGASVDARSDVYALGAMLYELLAGKPPYVDAEDVLTAVREGPPVDLVTLEPNAPRDLVAVVRRAMARAPQDRYDDAASYAAELSDFLEGRFVSAYDYSPRERVSRLVRRYPVATGLLALLALGTLAFVLAIDEARSLAEEARRLAEAGRAEAMSLEEAAVRREDELRLDQARRLAETEPERAIQLLAGLSAGTPFDGTVRSIYGAAMTAGPSPRWPVDPEASRSVAATMGWVATVQARGVELREVGSAAVDLVLGERPVHIVGALDACFVAAADDGVYVVVPGEAPRKALDLHRAIVGASSPAQSTVYVARSSAVAEVGCEGVVREWELPFDNPSAGVLGDGRLALLRGRSTMVWGPGDQGWREMRDCGRRRWGMTWLGDRLVQVGDDQGVCVWDGARGTIWDVPGPAWLEHLTTDGAGGVFVAGDGPTVYHLDARGILVEQLDVGGNVYDLAETDGGVWVGTDTELVRWSGSDVRRHPLPSAARRIAPIDSERAAVAVGDHVRVVDTRPRYRELRSADGSPPKVTPVDGRRVVVRELGSHRLADISGCGERWFAITEDGDVLRGGRPWLGGGRAQLVACGGFPGEPVVAVVDDASVRFFDADAAAEPTPLHRHPLTAPVTYVQVDSEAIVARAGSDVLVYEPGVGLVVTTLPSPVLYSAGHRGEVVVLTADGAHRIDDGHVEPEHLEPRAVAAMELHDDLVATGSPTGTITLWKAGEATALMAHERWVGIVVFSDDGRFLLSGGWDRYAALYDLSVTPPAGRRLGPQSDAVTMTAFLDGGILTQTYDGVVRVWSDSAPHEPGALRRDVDEVAQQLDEGRLLAPWRAEDVPVDVVSAADLVASD